jgi:hypothetical protein
MKRVTIELDENEAVFLAKAAKTFQDAASAFSEHEAGGIKRPGSDPRVIGMWNRIEVAAKAAKPK